MRTFYSFILFLSFSLCFSQTKEQLKEVIKNTNVSELNKLNVQFNKEHTERQVRIQSYLAKNPKINKRTIENGVEREIYDVINNDEVVYYNTSNFNSARTARADRLYSGGSLGLNIQGQGMTAHVWDGGTVRNTHVEFPNNKVTNADATDVSPHGTHVTGTIVAAGVLSTARGLAFNASAVAHDWTNDYAEMTTAASAGLLVSNHSYWIGNFLAPWAFGAYDYRARQFDQIAYNAPYYLAVTATGNDRNDGLNSVVFEQNMLKGGYDLIRGMQNAKNYLSVAASAQVLNYTSPSSVIMSNFSSWGPTDDGRIKPDLTAKGVNVRSTYNGSDTDYFVLDGTSMASPAVAGVSLLMQQYYFSLNQNYMRAATLKGLLLHTVSETGQADGPDYEFGWGLINAEAAAITIAAKNTNTAVIDEVTLNQNQTFTKTVTSSGTTPLTVSISWTDPAYPTANSGVVDPGVLYLVNDLDVRVVKTDNTIYFPWTLDPANVMLPAVRTQDNFRDNYEKVKVDNPSGTYNIVVTHKGAVLTGGLQNFSLVVTGPQLTLSSKEFAIDPNAISLYPNPANNILNFNVSEDVQISSIAIMDVTGKVINSSYNLNQKTIDVSNIQSGVYFVRFTSENKTVTKKFIKN